MISSRVMTVVANELNFCWTGVRGREEGAREGLDEEEAGRRVDGLFIAWSTVSMTWSTM